MSLAHSPRSASPAVSSYTLEEPGTSSECEDDPDDQMSLLAAQPRSATCSRPPCLKRASELGCSSTSVQPSLAATSVGRPAVASVFSFAAPRSFPSAPAFKRQVTFDAAPPEAFVTFHPEDYDRTQIEITQGGSDLDLRLPTKCKRYNGEGGEEEEEASEVEDDASEDGSARGSSRDSGAGWACLKSGSVVGSVGGTLTAGIPRPPVDPSVVSLPVHGFKSFGGFGQHPKTNQVDEHTSQSLSDTMSDDGIGSDVESSDNGAAAMEAAALASKSPNVTPRASPRIVPRWARCTGYFDEAASANTDMEHEMPSGRQQAPELKDITPVATPPLVKEAQSPQQAQRLMTGDLEMASEGSTSLYGFQEMHSPMEVDQSSPNLANRSSDTETLWSGGSSSPTQRGDGSQAHPSEASRSTKGGSTDAAVTHNSEGTPAQGEVVSAFASLHCQDSSGEGHSSSNESQACHSSPSPMSSRCSSTDPWSNLSSEDEGARSPAHGLWSSCTSPDMMPFKTATSSEPKSAHLHVAPDQYSSISTGGAAPQTKTYTHSPSMMQSAFFTVPAVDDADVSGEAMTHSRDGTSLLLPGPQKSVLRSALTRLEAEMAGTGGSSVDRSGDVTSSSSCISSGCTSADEDGVASTSRLSASGAGKPRRKSSLSSSFGEEACRTSGEGGRRERRSSRPGHCSRKSSLSTGREEDEGGRSGSHSPSPSPDTEEPMPSRKRHGSKSSRSGSGSSSTRSGSSSRIRMTRDREETEIEDEGALGGF
ncbi:hypothetical protein BCV69DRAFT_115381 [Microstroma glucosiphilum]|uniref:Uncharacterized protein n=1 Tax=Pseudomicrostroma glucosiphilum TaxID=1684307 RepID=A0A316UDL8_9BASI|nr:hypothetical protein BCV69DRAFT_115381 [Pseudomicrostroma glucosiphilum]PWN23306.1 hypothetical protein BCV69DRAFT_115381 [Pseudomicrostroma glucosiphilum]